MSAGTASSANTSSPPVPERWCTSSRWWAGRGLGAFRGALPANAAVEGAQGFSFPSAHSATSVAVYATIALILIRASRRGHSRIAVASMAGALNVARAVADESLRRTILGQARSFCLRALARA